MQIIKLKGYTSWAIGLSVAQLTQSLLRNTGNVHAVTVNVQGHHGVQDVVFLSLPAVLGAHGEFRYVLLPSLGWSAMICWFAYVLGIRAIVKQNLNDKDKAKFLASATQLKKLQDDLQL